MKILELFAGTRSIGKAFEAKGHEVFSVEWNKDFKNIDLYDDVNNITTKDILEKFGHPDVVWASPDCTTFSIAAISHHRRKNQICSPKSVQICSQGNRYFIAQQHQIQIPVLRPEKHYTHQRHRKHHTYP